MVKDRLKPGTKEYAAVKARYEAEMEDAGWKRVQVGESFAWTRPAVSIDEKDIVRCDEDHEPPFELDLYMHDFLEAIDNTYTIWHLTYPEEPKSFGGSAGHRAGRAAFIKTLRKYQETSTLTPTEIEQRIDREAREHLGVSGPEAVAMLDRGELEGTILQAELSMLRGLLGR
jgi:hypothetical protein